MGDGARHFAASGPKFDGFRTVASNLRLSGRLSDRRPENRLNSPIFNNSTQLLSEKRQGMDEQKAAAVRDGKRLLRLSRTGAMATLDNGLPLTTLVGVASDWDGAPMFVISELSAHTKRLNADPRVSLLLTSEGGRGDPLNQPRVTLNGSVRRREGADGKQRYVQRNPKSKLYIDFADMSLRRLDVEAVHFNGGFGRADALTWADLSAPGDVSALAAKEAEWLERIAALGDATLTRLAGQDGGRRVWRPVGIDAEGLDLAAGGEAARVDFDAPAFAPAAWWAALEQAVENAKA
jgi:heme iron utilization protein